MFESRAQQLGLIGGRSPKSMVARTKRTLVSVRARLEGLAAPYAEIDNSVEVELQELMGKFDEFARKLDETAEWLLEEAPY